MPLPPDAPTVATTTARWWLGLPEAYQLADSAQGYPLLKYLSLLGDQAGEVEVLLDRIAYVPPDSGGDVTDTSDLVDPATADLGWLPWLAALVGVVLPQGVTGQAARDLVSGASGGFHAGSQSAIAVAAQSALTGTRYASVYDHSVSTVGDGGVWDVLVVTRLSETPTNLLPTDAAASFEDGSTGGWTVAGTSAPTQVNDSTRAYDGGKSVRVTFPSGSSAATAQWRRSDVSFSAGVTYAVSAWVLVPGSAAAVDAAGWGLTVAATGAAGSGAVGSTSRSAVTVAASAGSWQRVVTTVTPSTTGYLTVQLDHTAALTAAVAVNVDAVQVQATSPPTGFVLPSHNAVVDAITMKGVKPAGVVIRARFYTATWTAEQTAYPTWASRNGLPWVKIEEAGL